jgi:hypothetical protein
MVGPPFKKKKRKLYIYIFFLNQEMVSPPFKKKEASRLRVILALF